MFLTMCKSIVELVEVRKEGKNFQCYILLLKLLRSENNFNIVLINQHLIVTLLLNRLRGLSNLWVCQQ